MGQFSGVFSLSQVTKAVRDRNWTNVPPPNVEYLVVAGGGAGGGNDNGGGGGAGGFRTGTGLSVTAGTAYTVTVGAGGAGILNGTGANGNNSVFSTITSTGGGGGSKGKLSATAGSGGSGGGAGSVAFGGDGGGIAGSGNTPAVSPSQGNNGGATGNNTNFLAGGGGGASAAGAAGTSTGYGGAGIASDISGTRTTYAGGGGGGTDVNPAGSGGAGGGGNGTGNATGNNGTANTGGGGGGAHETGGAGGSGIVIISYPDTYAAAASTTGSPTVSTSGSGSISFPDAGGTGGTSGPGYIQFAGTSALAIGTTGTYECWIYPTRYAGIQHRIFSQASASGPDISYDASNLYIAYTPGGSYATVSGAPPLNTWTHIAIVFNSGTLTVYYNGVAKSLSGTTTGYNMTSTATMFISGYYGIAGQYGILGYLSNVRIVKGVAVYTGAFTSPTAPLQATQAAGTNISAITGTQTSLLLNSVSGAYLADSSTNSYAPSSVSTGTAAPTWNSASPFATGLGYKNRVYTWTSSGSITF